MKKIIKLMALGMVFFSLVGCDEDQVHSPVEGDTTEAEESFEPTQWGDLSCQKERNCQSPVLNYNYGSLRNFLVQEYQKPMHSLFCGRTLKERWSRLAGHATWSEAEFSHILSFMTQILNLENCMVEDDLEEKLNNYFKNSEDYKNEIH